jgi:Zn-dependent M28 family amino/carboxypeptidase
MAIKGENGIVYIWDTSAYKPLACLTSTSLSSALSIIESTTKCFPGVTKKTPSTVNNTISCEGEFIDTTTAGGDTAKASHDKLFLLQQAKTKVSIKYDTDVTNVDSVKYFGDAYFTDLELTQGSGDEISTFSVTIEIDGGIVLTDPND